MCALYSRYVVLSLAAAAALASSVVLAEEPGYSKNRAYGYFGHELTRNDLKHVRNDDSYQYFELKRPFLFRDRGGRSFVAVPGVELNGASIPEVFRPIVGQPWDWESGYVPAAVVHDVYCTEPHRNEFTCWRVHRMFYDAARANGTEKNLARKMYAAILIGGPKWLLVFEQKAVPAYRANAEGVLEEVYETQTVSRAVQAPTRPELSESEQEQKIAELVEFMREKEEEQNVSDYVIELSPP